jgi:uracil-DNA glycosylase
MNKQEKQKALDKIAQEIENCRVCKEDKIGVAVPGEGNPDAQIMFLGEAPGKQEAETGRPFIGRSGKLLRKLIQEVGLKEEDVYITSPVKYLPKRGTPTPKEIAHGKVHLDKQIEVINPKIIVLLGSVAAQGALGEKIPTLKNHGNIVERDGRRYLLTIHPAAVLRFPKKFKSLMLEDFEKLKKLATLEN